MLAVVAITLGVALGLAIHLINRVAADEVAIAARSLFGLADLAIEGTGAGFDEGLYPRAARVPGVRVASPVVQIEARIIGRRGALTLLGMDVFRSRQLQPAFALNTAESGETTVEGEPVFLSASAARELELEVGDVLRVQSGLRPQEFVVAGVLPQAALEDRAGIIDIASAQWRFDRLGLLSRINLKLAAGADQRAVRADLDRLLPANARIVTPGDAASDAARLSQAYRSNLTALALVALFTGGFFVYSTQSLATLRRRREFALLHALGVTRRQQLLMILGSGGLIGLGGALLGIAAGTALAQLGVERLGTDLGAGYFASGVRELELPLLDAAVFCALGALVAIAGSLQPALDAARVPTALALKAGDVAGHEVRSHVALVSSIFVLAAAILWLRPIAGLPLPGYVSIALLIVGTVIAMPSVLLMLLTHAPHLRSVPWEMAMSHLRGTARQATLSVSAIVVSFSLMVAMAIMVTSFRESLDHWMQRLLPADVYVRAGYVGQSSHMDSSAVARLNSIDGVERVAVSRFAEAGAGSKREPVTLIARDLGQADAGSVLWLEESTSAPVPQGQIPVWISQAVGDRFGLHSGQNLELHIGGRSVTAAVRGIWRDYEHTRGAIVMDRAAYVSLTGDAAINTVWLWLAPDASDLEVQRRIRETMPPGAAYEISTPRELRRLSLQAFDRAFAVTYILELIAIVIGLFGIAAGTSAQVLARRREFGVLRHIGLTRRQIAATLAIEGAGLGLVGVVAGLVTGGLVSLILVHVVNRQSFHWSMDLFVPAGALIALSLTLIASAALIAVVSGRQAMRGDVIAAVKEDW